MSFYVVSVYLADRAYGGPEEGGWWYDTYEPVTDARVFDGWPGSFGPYLVQDEGTARRLRDELQSKLDKTVNVGRREIGSVLSDGEYRAIIDEDEWPAPYPAQRPYYS